MQLKPAILSQFCFVIKQVISKYIIDFIRSVAETKMMNKIQKPSKEKNHNLKIRNECELIIIMAIMDYWDQNPIKR